MTVLALVGLLGPTLQSIDEVEKTDEMASIVNTVNSFLYSAPNIALGSSTRFETIYNAVTDNDYAQLYVFRAFRDDDSTDVVLRLGFNDAEPVNTNAMIDSADFENAAGPIYRVVLTPSSTIPLSYHNNTTTNSDGVTIPARDPGTESYSLKSAFAGDVEQYNEGYFSMEVRIYAEDPGPQFDDDRLPPTYSTTFSLAQLRHIQPIFTYDAGIVY